MSQSVALSFPSSRLLAAAEVLDAEGARVLLAPARPSSPAMSQEVSVVPSTP